MAPTQNHAGVFEALDFPVHNELAWYGSTRGYTRATDLAAARRKWGENAFEIPQPSFLALLGEAALAPFFVFQVSLSSQDRPISSAREPPVSRSLATCLPSFSARSVRPAQVFCVLLWCLDEYWYYSLFTLAMLIVFECTVVLQRQGSMRSLREMRRPPYPVRAAPLSRTVVVVVVEVVVVVVVSVLVVVVSVVAVIV